MNTVEVDESCRGARCKRIGGTDPVDVEDMSKTEREWGGGEKERRAPMPTDQARCQHM